MKLKLIFLLPRDILKEGYYSGEFSKAAFWQEKEGQFPKNIIIACLVSVSDQFGAAVVLVVIKRVE